MPDRLLSLVILVGFWVPPALFGWMVASTYQRSNERARKSMKTTVLPAIVVLYAVAWFLLNLIAMPPYIPGATMDPVFPPSQRAIVGLAVFTALVVLPGSGLACYTLFRSRMRTVDKSDSKPI